jgi:uncharacterized membrane protein YdbT with pleckstrin-like domain
MGYIDHNLTAGETVIYETRLHWIVMLRPIVTGFVLALCALGLFYYAETDTKIESNTLHILVGAGVVLLLAGIASVLIGIARRNATEMAVTNRRVVIKVGLMARRTVEMMLNKVESIEVKESAFGRMLGYGTIVVIGTGGTPEPFFRIARPLLFRTTVQQQIQKGS